MSHIMTATAADEQFYEMSFAECSPLNIYFYGKRNGYWNWRCGFGHRPKTSRIRLFRSDHPSGYGSRFCEPTRGKNSEEPVSRGAGERHAHGRAGGTHARARSHRDLQRVRVPDELLRARSLPPRGIALHRHGSGYLLGPRREETGQEFLRGRNREIQPTIPRSRLGRHPLHGHGSRRGECLRPLGDGPLGYGLKHPRAGCRQRRGARIPLRRALLAGDIFRGTRRATLLCERRSRGERQATGNRS